MHRSLVKHALVAVAAANVALVTSPAFAQATGGASAAETGVTDGFGKIQSIVDLAIPLMIGIAAVVVAAMWGMKMLKRG